MHKNYGSLISELRESLGWMDSVFSNINEGILVVQNDMKALFANNAVAGMVGKSPIALLGKPVWEILELTADGKQLQKSDYLGALEQNNTDSLAGRYQLHEDQALKVDITVSIIPNKDQAVFIIRDVTQQFQSEQERKLRTEELKRSNEELESFTYSVSHDLRAPLRAISGYSNILLEDSQEQLNEKEKEYLKIVRDEATRMGKLIDSLLSFSRMSRREKEYSSINMESLVNFAWKKINEAHQGLNPELVYDNLHKAYGDKELLRQVWLNLIGNAVKYRKEGRKPRIVIGSDQNEQKSHTVYYVKDNGVGFNMKYADKLFGVFQRLHSDDEFEGTGIGLALVRRIINRHGGDVWAESEIDKGTTFYFSLPNKKLQ